MSGWLSVSAIASGSMGLADEWRHCSEPGHSSLEGTFGLQHGKSTFLRFAIAICR